MVDFYLRLRPFVSFFSSNKSDFVASSNLIFNSQIFPRFYLKSLETFFYRKSLYFGGCQWATQTCDHTWVHQNSTEVHYDKTRLFTFSQPSYAPSYALLYKTPFCRYDSLWSVDRHYALPKTESCFSLYRQYMVLYTYIRTTSYSRGCLSC